MLRKIRNKIDRLKLNLNNKTVLTEAAIGSYAVTAISAALAGAKVYALVRNSKYGTENDVIDYFDSQLNEDHVSHHNLKIVHEFTNEMLNEADIITNSGHVRPIDVGKINKIKSDAIIALMYEAWEFRKSDIDLEKCREKKIKIVATNERHPEIAVFNYLGDMAIKLVLDAGLSLYGNEFILVSNNDFGPYISKTLSKVVKKLGVIDLPKNFEKYDFSNNVKWLTTFPKLEIPHEYFSTEAIILNAYPFDYVWAGSGNEYLFKTEDLQSKLKFPRVLRFAGDINTDDFKKSKIPIYPKQVLSGHMGVIPSEVGLDPIINLQIGSLKCAELAHNKEELIYNGFLIGEYL